MLFRVYLTNPTRLATSISAVALTVSLAACSGANSLKNNDTGNSSSSNSPEASSDKLALKQDVSLFGAGTSFPASLYQRWFADFNKKHPDVQINYQAVSSDAGVSQFIASTVDFGASDSAMKDEEIKAVEGKGILLLPMTAGSIVIAYNLPSVTGELNLPRQVYTDIFLGKIKKWNAPKIVAANPGVELPDQDIKVVYRSDSSSTTEVFTKHLSAISSEWKRDVGEGKTVEWLTGTGVKDNQGILTEVRQTSGAIAYVDYGYAKQNNLKVAALENKAGKFIVPSEESALKTLESVKLPDNLRVFPSNPDGQQSYPLVSYTWLLVYKKYYDLEKAKVIEAIIEYGLTDGQQISTELGYIPLPRNVRTKVAAAADQISSDYKITVSE